MKMKRIISVFLCAVLLLSALPTAFASFDRNDLNGYPVVIVPGFMNAQMHVENEDGTTEKAWLGGFDEALKTAGLSAGKLIADGVSYGLGKENDLGRTLAPVVNSVIEKLACNPDGTSKYNVVTDVPPTAEASRWSNLRDEDLTLQDYIDDIISTDDIYICFTDFRMDPADNAKILDQLIDDIIKTTGCKKVNLLAQSYGGQVTGAYLSMYAATAGEKINSAVLMCPALGGAAVAEDFLTGDLDIEEEELVKFIEYSVNMEYDFHKLLASQPLGFLDGLAEEVLPTFTDVAQSWLSVWDFLPYESYKDMIDLLHPDQRIVEKTTWFHENIVKNYSKNLKKAQRSGVNITIVAGAGIRCVTGSNVNSDAIIPVAGATGATVAPYGQRFNDGYTCKYTVCKNKGHNHLSPSMEIDASTCYLPENTWIADGYYHGQEMKDSATKDLVLTQLLTNHPIKDVHSDPAHPQFHAADGRASKVFAAFDNSVEGYLGSGDTALVVRNCTHESAIFITDITVRGADISFLAPFKYIPEDGSASFAFAGEVPAQSLTRAAVTVSYIVIGLTPTPLAQRTFDFTLMNGDAPEYDAENPYAPADFEWDIDGMLGDAGASAVAGLGMTGQVAVVIASVLRMIEIVKTLIAVFRSFGG
ncbi:MAG: hypothetical protein IJL26_09475 [Clostridia bacterium]|nr:hypothetical protein [Clostridia bacterium]